MLENIKRVFLIVLDSLGAGFLPDAESYGDAGSNTLLSVSRAKNFHCPTLVSAGLFNLPGLEEAGGTPSPFAAHGRAGEESVGKDSIVGHWEIAGLVTKTPFPLYPDGFPKEDITAFESSIGHKTLCNKPYSGTQVIKDYGGEHLRTKSPIVYTSADSVFQIACHEEIFPVEQQYENCLKAREILSGVHAVARVIARPFSGEPGFFYRTENRRDFSLPPTGETILDKLYSAGKDVIGIGKVVSIFSGRGFTREIHTANNTEGIEKILDCQKSSFNGLCFANLVDFDMIYGHRNDIEGYAAALGEFDRALGDILKNQAPGDVYIITADHGCDPATPSTDHSREYVPILCFGAGVRPSNIGTRKTFADIGATVCELLGAPPPEHGESFLNLL